MPKDGPRPRYGTNPIRRVVSCCPSPRRCLARLLMMIDRDEGCFPCGTRREDSVHEMNRLSRSQEVRRLCRSTRANMHERYNLNSSNFRAAFLFYWQASLTASHCSAITALQPATAKTRTVIQETAAELG